MLVLSPADAFVDEACRLGVDMPILNVPAEAKTVFLCCSIVLDNDHVRFLPVVNNSAAMALVARQYGEQSSCNSGADLNLAR